MKLRYLLSAMLMGGCMMVMTSCDDDNGSNPTLRQPETFSLNTPALAETAIDLQATTDNIVLTWSQPDYGGFPSVTTYYVQYSTSEDFQNLEVFPDLEDENAVRFIQEDEPLTVCNAEVAVDDLNRNVLKMLNITDDADLPAEQTVYFRVTAQTYSTELIYSNVVSIRVQPYFQALVAADPFVWYMTGSCIGDGSWSSTVPFGCMPMYTTPDNTYDELDGTGDIVWSGYLSPDGFKFRGSPDDNWAVQIGQGDAFGEFKLNDGGSANISVPVAGIYDVVLNTKTNTPTIVEHENQARTFNGIAIAGSWTANWDDEPMTPITTVGENHDWYLQFTFDAGTVFKFKMAGSWDFNWGGTLVGMSSGYYGKGEQNGYDLYVSEAGTYDIYFNDILGVFRLVRQ